MNIKIEKKKHCESHRLLKAHKNKFMDYRQVEDKLQYAIAIGYLETIFKSRDMDHFKNMMKLLSMESSQPTQLRYNGCTNQRYSQALQLIQNQFYDDNVNSIDRLMDSIQNNLQVYKVVFYNMFNPSIMISNYYSIQPDHLMSRIDFQKSSLRLNLYQNGLCQNYHNPNLGKFVEVSICRESDYKFHVMLGAQRQNNQQNVVQNNNFMESGKQKLEVSGYNMLLKDDINQQTSNSNQQMLKSDSNQQLLNCELCLKDSADQDIYNCGACNTNYCKNCIVAKSQGSYLSFMQRSSMKCVNNTCSQMIYFKQALEILDIKKQNFRKVRDMECFECDRVFMDDIGNIFQCNKCQQLVCYNCLKQLKKQQQQNSDSNPYSQMSNSKYYNKYKIENYKCQCGCVYKWTDILTQNNDNNHNDYDIDQQKQVMSYYEDLKKQKDIESQRSIVKQEQQNNRNMYKSSIDYQDNKSFDNQFTNQKQEPSQYDQKSLVNMFSKSTIETGTKVSKQKLEQMDSSFIYSKYPSSLSNCQPCIQCNECMNSVVGVILIDAECSHKLCQPCVFERLQINGLIRCSKC